MEFLSLEEYPCLQEHVNELCGDVIPTLKIAGGCLQKELGLVMVTAESCVVAGFIMLSPAKSKHGINMSVKRFQVLEECRPEGWVKMLLLEAEKWVRKLGHTQITVETSLCKGTVFQDLGYSSKKGTSGKILRKRLVLQKSPVHSQPLALLQQLCDKLTTIEEKNVGNNTKEVTLLIVPWIRQLSEAACMSGVVCCNMASMYTVQPRAVKCMLKKDGRKRISLDNWHLCNLKTRKVDRRICEGRFDGDNDSKNKGKMKSLRIKNGKNKLRNLMKSTSFSYTKDGFTNPMPLPSNIRSRSNSADPAVLKDILGYLPQTANTMDPLRRSTYDFASQLGQNTDYIRVSSPAWKDLGLTESNTGTDFVVTGSVSSSPTILSILSHSFSCSYDDTVAIGPPAAHNCGISRVRSHPLRVPWESPFSTASKILTPTSLDFEPWETLINEQPVWETVLKKDNAETVTRLQDEPKKPIRFEDGESQNRKLSSHLISWTTPAPMRRGNIVEQTTLSSFPEDFASRDPFPRILTPMFARSHSSTTPSSSRPPNNFQVRTPDMKWSKNYENRFREPRYCTAASFDEVQQCFDMGFKRRHSRHKRNSSLPFAELEEGTDALRRAKGEAETGPAEPLRDTADLAKRFSALTDRSPDVPKPQLLARFGPSLTNVPQIPEHSELFNLLQPLIEAQKALEFGSRDTQSTSSKFKKSRELLQSLLRELQEVLPKESQRERVIAMATSCWSQIKHKRILKLQRGKQIDSRSIAMLYNKEKCGLNVTTLSFDTDLIRHYVVDKFMPVCVPYRDLVLLSDSNSNASGQQRSTRGSKLYMLIVGCVEDSYRQYLYGTERLFVVMFPKRDGLHLCSEKDLLSARASLSVNNHRGGSSREMLVFSLN